MKRYFIILILPIIATIINALLSPIYSLLPIPFGEILFNLVRIAIWFFAGWRLAILGGFGLWKSSLSGPVMLFVDHPIIKGGYFLIRQDFMAFAGVLLSYCMFVLIPVAISAIGATIGKRTRKQDRTSQ